MNQIELTLADGIAHVRLNRPEQRNALSLQMLRALAEVTDRLSADRAAQVVVVSGSGPVFSAGHDLGEMVDRDIDFYDELFAACTEVMLGLQALPQPVIARVHGMATAAGCQLVAACDLAVATEDCRFATPGVKIGLFCSTPMVPISRAIGRKRALEMLLTGEPIDAATAVDWGLINQAVPEAELDAAISNLADLIMRHSAHVTGIGKRAFYHQIDRSERAGYDAAIPVMTTNAFHADAQEGMTAFLEKRPPDWPSRH